MSYFSNKFKSFLIRVLPLVLFLIFWQIASGIIDRGVFFFGSPYSVGKYIALKTLDGSLLADMGITFFETISGFTIGNLIGTAIGLTLWYFPRGSYVAKPYIIIMGSIPIFAVTPIIIIWFGIGIKSKIILSALSTLAVSVVQAYEGANQTDKKLIEQLYSLGASKFIMFKKVVIPSTVTWIFAGAKINVSFALLGAFIGEFISSEVGLGHTIIEAMGLFNIPLVLSGVIGICVIAILLTSFIGYLQKKLIPWEGI